jgi:hypothetical protein
VSGPRGSPLPPSTAASNATLPAACSAPCRPCSTGLDGHRSVSLVKGHRALCPFARAIGLVSPTIARWPSNECSYAVEPTTYTTRWDAARLVPTDLRMPSRQANVQLALHRPTREALRQTTCGGVRGHRSTRSPRLAALTLAAIRTGPSRTRCGARRTAYLSTRTWPSSAGWSWRSWIPGSDPACRGEHAAPPAAAQRQAAR